MRKFFKRIDVIIIAAVLVVAGAGLLIRHFARESAPKSGLYAEIYHGGQVVRIVSLDEEGSFSLDALPEVVFEVKDGAIAFVHSDCPDQLCVFMGWQKVPGGFAACLPNDVMLWVDSYDNLETDIVAR